MARQPIIQLPDFTKNKLGFARIFANGSYSIDSNGGLGLGGRREMYGSSGLRFVAFPVAVLEMPYVIACMCVYQP